MKGGSDGTGDGDCLLRVRKSTVRVQFGKVHSEDLYRRGQRCSPSMEGMFCVVLHWSAAARSGLLHITKPRVVILLVFSKEKSGDRGKGYIGKHTNAKHRHYCLLVANTSPRLANVSVIPILNTGTRGPSPPCTTSTFKIAFGHDRPTLLLTTFSVHGSL